MHLIGAGYVPDALVYPLKDSFPMVQFPRQWPNGTPWTLVAGWLSVWNPHQPEENQICCR